MRFYQLCGGTNVNKIFLFFLAIITFPAQSEIFYYHPEETTTFIKLLPNTITIKTPDGGKAVLFSQTPLHSFSFTEASVAYDPETEYVNTYSYTNPSPIQTTEYVSSSTTYYNSLNEEISYSESKSFYNNSYTTYTSAYVYSVPEPEEWAMMLLGFGMVGWQVKRKKMKAAPEL